MESTTSRDVANTPSGNPKNATITAPNTSPARDHTREFLRTVYLAARYSGQSHHAAVLGARQGVRDILVSDSIIRNTLIGARREFDASCQEGRVEG